MVALEAMAGGVPVAAFAVGSLPRMLADDAGILAPRGDFDCLVDVLDRLSMSPEERAALIEAANRRVTETYDIAAVARDLLDNIYRPLTDCSS
jgi:glycosyltransferase involved in cell wall biosynthesis